MRKLCDDRKHDDVVVIYDTYGTSSCPLCDTMDELDEANLTIERLEARVEELENEISVAALENH